MNKQEAIAFLRNKLAQVEADPDRSGGADEYCDDLAYAIERVEAGDDIEEVMGNV